VFYNYAQDLKGLLTTIEQALYKPKEPKDATITVTDYE